MTREKGIFAIAIGSLLIIIVASTGAYILKEQRSAEQQNPAVLAIDSASTITNPAWFKQARQQGIELYILHSTAWGTCHAWARTQTQLGMALQAGMKVAAYTRDPNC